jgi:carotenoid cleavage dioxygenase-like enzyme
MARPLDPKSFLIDAWRPWKQEETFEITDIEGEIPREIHGTLYRNGPSQKIDPPEGNQALHLFDGDALIHAWRITDGRVRFTGRYVRTPSFPRRAGRGARLLLLRELRAEGRERSRAASRVGQHEHRLARREAHGARGERLALRAGPAHARHAREE